MRLNKIPVVIIGHGDLPRAFIDSAQMIIGIRENIYSLCLYEGDGLDNFIIKTSDMINKFDEENFILVFVDLQGGTPWNAVVGINDPRIRLVTGLNLPMLLEVLCLRDHNDDIEDLVQCALDAANMSVVSKIFSH